MHVHNLGMWSIQIIWIGFKIQNFFSHRRRPSSHVEAIRLQAQNLEIAANSRVASRVQSRIGSIAPSLIASAIQSRRASRPLSNRTSTVGSRRGSVSGYLPMAGSGSASEAGNPETLENLIHLTQNQESILQTYYTNDEGKVVTLSLYDISDTDPADILGNDVMPNTQPIASHDNYERPLDFNEEVARKISTIRRRSVQISGDSHHE